MSVFSLNIIKFTDELLGYGYLNVKKSLNHFDSIYVYVAVAFSFLHLNLF